jgi:hypothetical protein
VEESETQEVQESQSPASFQSSLGGEKEKAEIAEAPVEVTPEAAPAPETVAPEAPQEAPKLDPQVQELEDLKANGLLKALTSERKKRQELQEQLNQYQQSLQSQPYVPETYDSGQQIAPDPTAAKVENRLLAMSEMQARSQHPDYDEKLNVFAAEAIANPALYESVMSSDHPALAAYEAGKALLVHKKYGTSLDKVIEGVRKETESELRKQIRAEIEQEFTGKIAARAKAPTNISAVGSRGGVPVEEQAPMSSWATTLRPKRKR